MESSITVDTGSSDMIVKRVSVPLGLEELMEGLTKEVILKKPKDLYIFASEYFVHLLHLRDQGLYKGIARKTHTVLRQPRFNLNSKSVSTDKTQRNVPIKKTTSEGDAYSQEKMTTDNLIVSPVRKINRHSEQNTENFSAGGTSLSSKFQNKTSLKKSISTDVGEKKPVYSVRKTYSTERNVRGTFSDKLKMEPVAKEKISNRKSISGKVLKSGLKPSIKTVKQHDILPATITQESTVARQNLESDSHEKETDANIKINDKKISHANDIVEEEGKIRCSSVEEPKKVYNVETKEVTKTEEGYLENITDEKDKQENEDEARDSPEKQIKNTLEDSEKENNMKNKQVSRNDDNNILDGVTDERDEQERKTEVKDSSVIAIKGIPGESTGAGNEENGNNENGNMKCQTELKSMSMDATILEKYTDLDTQVATPQDVDKLECGLEENNNRDGWDGLSIETADEMNLDSEKSKSIDGSDHSVAIPNEEKMSEGTVNRNEEHTQISFQEHEKSNMNNEEDVRLKDEVVTTSGSENILNEQDDDKSAKSTNMHDLIDLECDTDRVVDEAVSEVHRSKVNNVVVDNKSDSVVESEKLVSYTDNGMKGIENSTNDVDMNTENSCAENYDDAGSGNKHILDYVESNEDQNIMSTTENGKEEKEMNNEKVELMISNDVGENDVHITLASSIDKEGKNEDQVENNMDNPENKLLQNEIAENDIENSGKLRNVDAVNDDDEEISNSNDEKKEISFDGTNNENKEIVSNFNGENERNGVLVKSSDQENAAVDKTLTNENKDGPKENQEIMSNSEVKNTKNLTSKGGIPHSSKLISKNVSPQKKLKLIHMKSEQALLGKISRIDNVPSFIKQSSEPNEAHENKKSIYTSNKDNIKLKHTGQRAKSHNTLLNNETLPEKSTRKDDKLKKMRSEDRYHGKNKKRTGSMDRKAKSCRSLDVENNWKTSEVVRIESQNNINYETASGETTKNKNHKPGGNKIMEYASAISTIHDANKLPEIPQDRSGPKILEEKIPEQNVDPTNDIDDVLDDEQGKIGNNSSIPDTISCESEDSAAFGDNISARTVDEPNILMCTPEENDTTFKQQVSEHEECSIACAELDTSKQDIKQDHQCAVKEEIERRIKTSHENVNIPECIEANNIAIQNVEDSRTNAEESNTDTSVDSHVVDEHRNVLDDAEFIHHEDQHHRNKRETTIFDSSNLHPTNDDYLSQELGHVHSNSNCLMNLVSLDDDSDITDNIKTVPQNLSDGQGEIKKNEDSQGDGNSAAEPNIGEPSVSPDVAGSEGSESVGHFAKINGKMEEVHNKFDREALRKEIEDIHSPELGTICMEEALPYKNDSNFPKADLNGTGKEITDEESSQKHQDSPDIVSKGEKKTSGKKTNADDGVIDYGLNNFEQEPKDEDRNHDYFVDDPKLNTDIANCDTGMSKEKSERGKAHSMETKNNSDNSVEKSNPNNEKVIEFQSTESYDSKKLMEENNEGAEHATRNENVEAQIHIANSSNDSAMIENINKDNDIIFNVYDAKKLNEELKEAGDHIARKQGTEEISLHNVNFNNPCLKKEVTNGGSFDSNQVNDSLDPNALEKEIKATKVFILNNHQNIPDEVQLNNTNQDSLQMGDHTNIPNNYNANKLKKEIEEAEEYVTREQRKGTNSHNLNSDNENDSIKDDQDTLKIKDDTILNNNFDANILKQELREAEEYAAKTQSKSITNKRVLANKDVDSVELGDVDSKQMTDNANVDSALDTSEVKEATKEVEGLAKFRTYDPSKLKEELKDAEKHIVDKQSSREELVNTSNTNNQNPVIKGTESEEIHLASKDNFSLRQEDNATIANTFIVKKYEDKDIDLAEINPESENRANNFHPDILKQELKEAAALPNEEKNDHDDSKDNDDSRNVHEIIKNNNLSDTKSNAGNYQLPPEYVTNQYDSSKSKEHIASESQDNHVSSDKDIDLALSHSVNEMTDSEKQEQKEVEDHKITGQNNEEILNDNDNLKTEKMVNKNSNHVDVKLIGKEVEGNANLSNNYDSNRLKKDMRDSDNNGSNSTEIKLVDGNLMEGDKGGNYTNNFAPNILQQEGKQVKEHEMEKEHSQNDLNGNNHLEHQDVDRILVKSFHGNHDSLHAERNATSDPNKLKYDVDEAVELVTEGENVQENLVDDSNSSTHALVDHDPAEIHPINENIQQDILHVNNSTYDASKLKEELKQAEEQSTKKQNSQDNYVDKTKNNDESVNSANDFLKEKNTNTSSNFDPDRLKKELIDAEELGNQNQTGFDNYSEDNKPKTHTISSKTTDSGQDSNDANIGNYCPDSLKEEGNPIINTNEEKTQVYSKEPSKIQQNILNNVEDQIDKNVNTASSYIPSGLQEELKPAEKSIMENIRYENDSVDNCNNNKLVNSGTKSVDQQSTTENNVKEIPNIVKELSVAEGYYQKIQDNNSNFPDTGNKKNDTVKFYLGDDGAPIDTKRDIGIDIDPTILKNDLKEAEALIMKKQSSLSKNKRSSSASKLIDINNHSDGKDIKTSIASEYDPNILKQELKEAEDYIIDGKTRKNSSGVRSDLAEVSDDKLNPDILDGHNSIRENVVVQQHIEPLGKTITHNTDKDSLVLKESEILNNPIDEKVVIPHSNLATGQEDEGNITTGNFVGEPLEDHSLKAHTAARSIQASWRGYKIRKCGKETGVFGTTIEMIPDTTEQLTTPNNFDVGRKNSAQTIQSAWRAHKIRKNMKEVEDRINLLQKPTECDDEDVGRRTITDENIYNAATKIQANVRGFITRKQLNTTNKTDLGSIKEDEEQAKSVTKSNHCVNVSPKLEDGTVFQAMKALDKILIPNALPDEHNCQKNDSKDVSQQADLKNMKEKVEHVDRIENSEIHQPFDLVLTNASEIANLFPEDDHRHMSNRPLSIDSLTSSDSAVTVIQKDCFLHDENDLAENLPEHAKTEMHDYIMNKQIDEDSKEDAEAGSSEISPTAFDIVKLREEIEMKIIDHVGDNDKSKDDENMGTEKVKDSMMSPLHSTQTVGSEVVSKVEGVIADQTKQGNISTSVGHSNEKYEEVNTKAFDIAKLHDEIIGTGYSEELDKIPLNPNLVHLEEGMDINDENFKNSRDGLEVQDLAARKIQSLFRGYRVRRDTKISNTNFLDCEDRFRELSDIKEEDIDNMKTVSQVSNDFSPDNFENAERQELCDNQKLDVGNETTMNPLQNDSKDVQDDLSSTVSRENKVEDTKREECSASSNDQHATNSQVNQLPAGDEDLTSVASDVDVRYENAQASAKDVSNTEASTVNLPFSHVSMESAKRNNATLQNKNMEVQAATKIQAGFRGYQVRKQLKQKTNAAGDISKKSVRRKSSGRLTDMNRCSQQNKQKENIGGIEEKSAVKIQAGIRGFLVRRRQKKQKRIDSP